MVTDLRNSGIVELRNSGITEGQGKSNIAPTFSKRGYNQSFGQNLHGWKRTILDPSRNDRKIVDWDVKPQPKQTNKNPRNI